MSEPTNEDRANTAQHALYAFADALGDGTRKDLENKDRHGTFDAIADLITDLMHLGEREGFDLIGLLAHAHTNYERESVE